jgi:hypothetical protein
MVCTAALILATQPPTTCDIACDGASGWEKIGVSVQTLQRIRKGVSIPLNNNCQVPRFSLGVSLPDATLAQEEFFDRELARFVQAGARELSTYNDYVSRLFLVPKPGYNQWRLICDLRPINKF